MNAGQYLLALSPLPSGTAAQHLLAIQLGTGTGQTIFCSQRTVVFEQDATTVTRKPKQKAIADAQEPRLAKPTVDGQRGLYVHQSEQRLVVTGAVADEMTITINKQRRIQP